MSVAIPHFDLPFRFGAAGGHAAVVEQNTIQDVRNCVEACIRTEVGSRLYVPIFGISDPVFTNQPVDTVKMEEEVILNEPRAQLTFLSTIDEIDKMISEITVGVTNTQ
jgi:hypothetical protein